MMPEVPTAHIADTSSLSLYAFEGLPAIVDRLVGTPRERVRAAIQPPPGLQNEPIFHKRSRLPLVAFTS